MSDNNLNSDRVALQMGEACFVLRHERARFLSVRRGL